MNKGLLSSEGATSSTRWLAVTCTISGIVFTCALFTLAFLGHDLEGLTGVVMVLIGAGIAPKTMQNLRSHNENYHEPQQ